MASGIDYAGEKVTASRASEPTIIDVLDEVERNLSILDEAIGLHEDRARNVLRPEYEVKGGEKDGEEDRLPNRSPLLDKSIAINDRVQRLRRRIDSISERVQS